MATVRGRWTAALALAVVALGLLALATWGGWQWLGARGGDTVVDSGRQLLPPSDRWVEAGVPVWARGGVLRVGERSIALGDVAASDLTSTPYGVLVRVDRPDAPTPRERVTLAVTADGVAEVRGDPGDVVVAADGRHAAWIDREGPRQRLGRLAQVVVVDLATGRELLRSGAGMGDPDDDLPDLYSELDPEALGFQGEGEDLVVVYRDATGAGSTVGLRVRDGAPQSVPPRWIGGEARRLTVADVPEWARRPVIGTDLALRGRRLAASGAAAVLSPDARHVARTGVPGELVVLTVPEGDVVTPRYGDRAPRLGAWLGDGRLLVVTGRRGGDASVRVCRVGSGCTVVARPGRGPQRIVTALPPTG